MAYNHEYPYTDPERYNSDWLLNKVKEVEAKLIGIEDEIFRRSKDYIDEVVAPYQAQVTQLRADFNRLRDEVSRSQADFERNIVAQITLMNGRIDDIRRELEADIVSVNARTDLAIQQNNGYIFDVIESGIIGGISVINFFTGERVSVQDMFDYLARLHVDDGLTYGDLVMRDKTYSELAAFGISYTNLVLHGGSIII